eukprot:1145757-Pelagomonas_calceolata.AAC.7
MVDSSIKLALLPAALSITLPRPPILSLPTSLPSRSLIAAAPPFMPLAPLSLPDARKMLDTHHFGLDKIKDRYWGQEPSVATIMNWTADTQG